MLTKACTCHKACYMLLTIVQKPIVGSIATSNDTISVQLKMRLFIFVAFWLKIVVLRVGALWALHSIDWFVFEHASKEALFLQRLSWQQSKKRKVAPSSVQES